jgi:hypothetical protein
MKKLIILFVAIILLSGLFVSCRKDGQNGDPKTLIGGSYVNLDSTINQYLDISDPTKSVSIKLGKTVGEAIKSVNIYAATGDPLDSTKWVLIKSVEYKEGVVLTVTTAELATAFGSTPLEAGNSYTIQNEIVTVSGRRFSVHNTPTNYTSFKVYNIAFSWSAIAVCQFVQSEAVGLYEVTYDNDWQDYSVGDTINVFAGPDANSIMFYAYPSKQAGGKNRVPWLVKVDPATDQATMAQQIIGDYGTSVTGNKASATGLIFSCKGTISLSVDVIYGGSLYSGLKFELKKK